MKILCLCSAGAKRSNYLAFLLKGMGHDAIAAGVDMNMPETIGMLAAWADQIIVAQPFMADKIPGEANRAKVNNAVTIGPDVWIDPYTSIPELVQRCQAVAKAIGGP